MSVNHESTNKVGWRYCVSYTDITAGNTNYVRTIEYDSRIARIQGWGVDYPGSEIEVRFWSYDTNEQNKLLPKIKSKNTVCGW